MSDIDLQTLNDQIADAELVYAQANVGMRDASRQESTCNKLKLEYAKKREIARRLLRDLHSRRIRLQRKLAVEDGEATCIIYEEDHDGR